MGALVMLSIEYTEKSFRLTRESNLGPLGSESNALQEVNILKEVSALGPYSQTILRKLS